MSEVTVDTLKERWTDMMARADESAGRLPECYKELKRTVCRINRETIDIDEYYALAKRLTQLMETIAKEKRTSIFDYFLANIDPRKIGSARHFRYLCADLQDLLGKIDGYRKSRRRLQVVK